MNKSGVTLPSDSLMRSDLNGFIEETYKRFYVEILQRQRENLFKFL